jgi:hypothetical protein
MCRVRVIQDGKVIGSLPSHDDGGYTGSSFAVYSSNCGPSTISMVYQFRWLDEDGRPAQPNDQIGPAPSFMMEVFLVSDGLTLDELSAIEGWEAASRSPHRDPFKTLKGMF